jgi:DNA-directed RNA polymerase specialized sigma24 family protein
MRASDRTDMGGERERFLTTHWSMIENVRQEQNPDGAMIESLLQRYWKPVYCYLRSKGYDNERAKDLTQGFFCAVVLDRDLVQRADRTRGRFRTFLLHALDQYVINENAKQRTQKRHPQGRVMSLNAEDLPELPLWVDKQESQRVFDYAWMSSLLDNVISEVEAFYTGQDKSVYWNLLHDRILHPILDNTKPPTLPQLCERYAIENQRKASNMLVTVKRYFQQELIRHLRMTVLDEGVAQEELEEIVGFFSQGAQYPEMLRDILPDE